jgi:hypothetical protein
VASLLPLTDNAFQLKPLGESKVDSRAAMGVLVSRDGHRDVKLFFDAKSGHLAKSEFNVKSPEQGFKEVRQEIFYEQYEEVNGVRLPRKVTLKRDGEKFVEATISNLKTAEKLDDSMFDKP